MANLTKQRDEWPNFGFVYGRSGVTRGTTTSSAVISVNTQFSRQVVFALAYSEQTHSRVAAEPAQGSTGTYLAFQPLTPDGVNARFRVWRRTTGTFTTRVSTSLEKAIDTTATSLTGITYRWLAFGY